MKKSGGNGGEKHIQALIKGLGVLECFNDTTEYGITEIGEITNLPDSSVQRIVHTLEIKGYLYQNTDNRKYRLTPKVLLTYVKCGNLIRWKEQTRKHMVALNEFCGENVNLAVRQDQMCRYIELVESKHLLRPHFNLNDIYPIYCTSLGRSLLSDMTEAEIMSLLPDTLEARTPLTLTDKKKVIEKIKEIHETGYAIDDEEFYMGLCCVGSPVYGIGNKVIAALSVIAPKTRMDEKAIEKIAPVVITTAQNISEEYKKIFFS